MEWIIEENLIPNSEYKHLSTLVRLISPVLKATYLLIMSEKILEGDPPYFGSFLFVKD